MTIGIVETPGPRLINGSDINTIIKTVNGMLSGTTTGTYLGSYQVSNGLAVQGDTISGHTWLLRAYDNTASTYRTFVTFTNGNTTSMAIANPTDGSITIDGAVIGGTTPAAITGTTITANTSISSAGSLTFTAPASGVILKQGANGKCGTFVANGATPVTINNTSIAITDTIVISLNTVGGTVGAVPAVKTITASSGFTVAATASDTSTYNYAIISNAA